MEELENGRDELESALFKKSELELKLISQ